MKRVDDDGQHKPLQNLHQQQRNQHQHLNPDYHKFQESEPDHLLVAPSPGALFPDSQTTVVHTSSSSLCTNTDSDQRCLLASKLALKERANRKRAELIERLQSRSGFTNGEMKEASASAVISSMTGECGNTIMLRPSEPSTIAPAAEPTFPSVNHSISYPAPRSDTLTANHSLPPRYSQLPIFQQRNIVDRKEEYASQLESHPFYNSAQLLLYSTSPSSQIEDMRGEDDSSSPPTMSTQKRKHAGHPLVVFKPLTGCSPISTLSSSLSWTGSDAGLISERQPPNTVSVQHTLSPHVEHQTLQTNTKGYAVSPHTPPLSASALSMTASSILRPHKSDVAAKSATSKRAMNNSRRVPSPEYGVFGGDKGSSRTNGACYSNSSNTRPSIPMAKSKSLGMIWKSLSSQNRAQQDLFSLWFHGGPGSAYQSRVVTPPFQVIPLNARGKQQEQQLHQQQPNQSWYDITALPHSTLRMTAALKGTETSTEPDMLSSWLAIATLPPPTSLQYAPSSLPTTP